MGWITEGLKSNIGSGVVLADTGQLDAGNYSAFCMLISANLAAQCRIEWRNAANNANVWSQELYCTIAGPVILPGALYFSSFGQNERVRIVTSAALTLGSIQASFFLT